jgi:WD40 repeat protein
MPYRHAASMRRFGLAAAATVVLAARGLGQDTFRVSVDWIQGQASDDSFVNALSDDGRFIAFSSFADDLVAGDSNKVMDVFVHDALTGAIERVSVDSSGVQGDRASANAAISADGRFVVFDSWATNLASGGAAGREQVYLHDRTTSTTVMASVDSSGNPCNGFCLTPAISADGVVVAFASSGTNLVRGDMNRKLDVFVHDLASGLTERASVDSSGGEGNGDSQYPPALSKDGQFVSFASDATNLVGGDTNLATDVFVRDRAAGVTERVSVNSSGHQANGSSYAEFQSISSDGSIVAFRSTATNLVAGDLNGVQDVSSTTARAARPSS